MWGWEPSLHVETGLPHATRDAHTAFQISETPLQAFYRQRYLRDLERGSPAWFVDATGPGAFVFDNRSYFGHETLPELAEYVARHYTRGRVWPPADLPAHQRRAGSGQTCARI